MTSTFPLSFSGLTLILVASISVPCAAQRTPATVARPAKSSIGQPTARTQAVEAAGLAAQLSAYGTRTNSPLALLAAAQLLIDNPITPLGPKAQTRRLGGTSPSGTKTERGSVELNPAKLIATAQSMAGDNRSIATLASQLAQRAAGGRKGAIGGPKGIQTRAFPGMVDVYNQSFYGGERATALVRGDGDTDLDCYVYSLRSGQLVAVDDDDTDVCILNWYPPQNGTYRIEVRNHGSVYNEYTLITN